MSLLPSATEMLCALDLADQIVGISHECDFPADITDRPRVTSSALPRGGAQAEIDAAVRSMVAAGEPLYDVDADLLAELEPDLVVTQGLCEVCAVSATTVASAMGALPREMVEQARVLSLDGGSWADMLADLHTLGEACGHAAFAREVCAALQDRWDHLTAGAPPSAPPRVAMLEWVEPPFSGGHWVPEQVAAAGGVEVVGAPGKHSRQLSWAELRASDAQVIGVACCGFGLDANRRVAEALLHRPEAAGIPAVHLKQVWAFDANSYFSRPGPRLVRGAEVLAQVLRGQGPDPADAVRVG